MTRADNIRILTAYYKPVPGGCCKRYFRAINALLEKGFAVHYLSAVKFPIDHPNCFHHMLPWPEQYLDNIIFWAFFHLASPFIYTFLALKHDISHAFVFHPTYAFGLQFARFFKNISISVFYRADHILNHEIKGTKQWIISMERIIEIFSLKNTCVYCVSHTLSATLKSRISSGIWRSIDVLPNDVKIEKYEHIKDNVFRLATVGILEQRKNLEILITIMDRFKDLNIRLDIYGTGPFENNLKKLAETTGLTNLVRFHGWVDRNLIWPEVDLLLMPSLHEGSPNSVLEALGSDIPVLASNIPEHREILGNLQLLDPYNPEEWYSRIREIIEDIDRKLPALREYQDKYRDALKFDWDDIIVSYITN